MDIFSLGLTFLELADPNKSASVLRDAFHRFEEDEEFYAWMAEAGGLEEVLRQQIGALSDPLARSFAERMLERDPTTRANVRECKEHPWLDTKGACT